MKKFFDKFKKNKRTNISLNDDYGGRRFQKLSPTISFKRKGFVVFVILLALAFSIIGGAFGKFLERSYFKTELNALKNIQIKGGDCGAGEAVALKACPSVVGICSIVKNNSNSLGEKGLPPIFPFFDDYDDEEDDKKFHFSDGDSFKYIGSGSGVAYSLINDSKSAIFITNYHVVESVIKAEKGTGQVLIFLDQNVKNENDYLEAQVVNFDAGIDIAVLEAPLKGKPVVCAEIGDSDKLNSGQEIYAIGSPQGINFNRSITHGIISAPSRPLRLEGIKDEIKTIQIDAPINSGNSGGGLFDKNAKLIGICVAKGSGKVDPDGRVNSTEGMGFCLPIKTVDKVVKKMVENRMKGAPPRKLFFLGITPHNGTFFGNRKYTGGVIVMSVTPGSAAHKAGICAGDIIIELDGKTVKTYEDLQNALANKKDPAGKIKVKRRVGKKRGASYKVIELTVNFDN